MRWQGSLAVPLFIDGAPTSRWVIYLLAPQNRGSWSTTPNWQEATAHRSDMSASLGPNADPCRRRYRMGRTVSERRIASKKGGEMKTRTILAFLVVFFAGFALCFAADPNMGTWKLNDAKSKIGPGATKNTTVVYAAAGDSVKITVDGIDKDGKAMHNVWTGKFDGKDYPATGDPTYDTRSYKKVNDRTLDMTVKKGDKVTGTGRVVVAADGKSREVTLSVADSSGKQVKSTAVYDKQ
jgi:hypothetical protein